MQKDKSQALSSQYGVFVTRARIARGKFAHLALTHETDLEQGKGKRAASPTVAEEAEEFAFSLTHYLPVLVACIPPIGAVFGGTAAVWTDILLLVRCGMNPVSLQLIHKQMLVCYYLLQLVKVPWALYYASRAKRMAYSASHEGSELSSQAARDLRKTELGALLLTLLAPFLGSYSKLSAASCVHSLIVCSDLQCSPG